MPTRFKPPPTVPATPSAQPFNNAAPLISCIIVNYNAGKRLSECVESVLRNKIELEILVIDNASSDASIADLQSVTDHEPRIRIIRNIENTGFSKACNQGARLAQGDLLLFLNPACVVEQTAIPELVSALTGDGHAGMAGPLLLNPDGSEQAGGRRLAPTPGRSLIRMLPGKWFPGLKARTAHSDINQNGQPVPEQPVEIEAISGACMLVPRKTHIRTGGFDEGYFMHCEDLDLCMRFRLGGWKIFFVPSARVTHYAGTCSKTRPLFVEWHKHRGMVRYINKFLGDRYATPVRWLIISGVWMRLGAIALLRSFRQSKY